MEASNGQTQVVEVRTQVTRTPLQTQAQRTPDGTGLAMIFTVMVGGEPEVHIYTVGEPGKKAILDALTGGLMIPPTEVPPLS